MQTASRGAQPGLTRAAAGDVGLEQHLWVPAKPQVLSSRTVFLVRVAGSCFFTLAPRLALGLRFVPC